MTALTLTAAVAHLETEGVPTDSVIRAAQHVNDLLLSTPQAADKVNALTGEKVEGEHVMRVPLVYGYLVQGILKAHVASESAKLIDILAQAKVQADDLIEKSSWMFIADEDARQDIENADPEVVKAGKAKKGARKVLALRVYAAKIVDKDLTRKEAIAILCEEVGLTPAGASTYYANFKNGTWS